MPAVYFYKESEIQYPERLKVLKLYEKKLYLKSLENGDNLIAELTLSDEWSFKYNNTPFIITQRTSYLKQLFCAFDYNNTHQEEEDGVLTIRQCSNLSPKNELHSNVFQNHVNVNTSRLRFYAGALISIQNSDVFSDCILPSKCVNVHVSHQCEDIDLCACENVVIKHGCKHVYVNGAYGGAVNIENNCENVSVSKANGQKINVKNTNGLKIEGPEPDAKTWVYEKGKCTISY